LEIFLIGKDEIKMQSKNDHRVGVMVIGGGSTNTLGVVRGLRRRDIQVMFLDSDRNHVAWYSKCVDKRLICPDPKESEMQFVNFLMDISKRSREDYMIIPVGDAEAVVLSKYKEELEHFYLLPLPSFEIIKKLVNKKEFYKLLNQMSVPHAKTFFPEDTSELKLIGREIDYPYVVKPVYSHLFREEFRTKCFLINSYQELTQATEKLRDKNLEVVIQEIIPGKEIYMFYTYFNKESEAIAVCGYDKLRQCPPDFGSGSLCKSAWRQVPIDSAIQVLKGIKYHGIAEPEFKRDPRDGEYKLLEINARTSSENRLPARCGVDVEYIAYLDTIGQHVEGPISPRNGMLWIDEIGDLLSCLMQLKDGTLKIREICKSLRGKKEYAVFAWDDPVPFFIHLFNFSCAVLKFLLSHWRTYIGSMGDKES
jgi:predicted ATP-grasp superfamily ATP-dependent carboligase